jgi:transglutaminase-like putative cysteine protease
VSAARYRVRHETVYEYNAEVVHAHHLLHLTPRAIPRQTCTEHLISIDPGPSTRVETHDAFGNPALRLEFDRPHHKFAVISEMSVEIRDPLPGAVRSETWERVRAGLAYAARPPGEEKLEACRYRVESPHVRIKQVFNDYAADCFGAGHAVSDTAEALMHKLYRDMTYAPGATSIATPLVQVLEQRRGVCQDYSHLMIACLRSRGLAARYVSGYLRTHRRDGAPQLVGADASHAWVAVFCPPLGWIEFDPTNGVRAGLDHIALAWGRDFGDVSPVRGVILGGGDHRLTVSVSVAPVE